MGKPEPGSWSRAIKAAQHAKESEPTQLLTQFIGQDNIILFTARGFLYECTIGSTIEFLSEEYHVADRHTDVLTDNAIIRKIPLKDGSGLKML